MFNALKRANLALPLYSLWRVFRRIFPEKRLLIIVVGYTIVLSIVTILKHSFFFSTAWDLGIFNQNFWSTIHGRFFYYTVEPWLGESFFAVHFSPVLVFLVPFYAIYPRPETLLVLQSLIVALGAVPLYHLAREVIDGSFAIKLSLVYIINPMIIGANLFDFHVEIFLPLTLISLMYFLYKRNLKFYIIFLFLSLSTLEFAGFVTLFIIVHELAANVRRRERIKRLIPFLAITISMSLFWLFMANMVIANLRVPGTNEQSILTPLKNELLQNPGNIVSRLVANSFPKLWYVFLMLWPFFFTSLFSSHFLLSLPWLLVAFALNYAPYYMIGYQYSLVVIPFFAVSSIHGVKRLLAHVQVDAKRISTIIMISALIFMIWASPFLQFPFSSFDANYSQEANRIIGLIPENASVLTINNLQPHVSSRFEVWLLPPSYSEPYEGFETGISTIWEEYATDFLETKQPDFILWDINRGGIDAYNLNLTISRLLSRVHYGVYAFLDGILLLKEGFSGTPVLYERYGLTFEAADFISSEFCQIAEDPTSESGRVAVCVPSSKNVTCWETLVFIPKGRYVIRFGVKVSNIAGLLTGVFMVEAFTQNGELGSTIVPTIDVEEGKWGYHLFEFEVKDTIAYATLRGVTLSAGEELYMDNINIIQLGN